MTKYKYYFRKPKSEITKDILKILAASGVICVAVTSPYFVVNLFKNFKQLKKYKKQGKKVYNTFYFLKRENCIDIRKNGKQIYISLTAKGKKKANWLQIDDLKIKKPKKWDGRWRIVIFDISELKRIYREAFRGKLKELGFYPLQKSVWIHPFDCNDEISLLRTFFGLSDNELRFVVANNIGNDDVLKKIFKLK